MQRKGLIKLNMLDNKGLQQIVYRGNIPGQNTSHIWYA